MTSDIVDAEVSAQGGGGAIPFLGRLVTLGHGSEEKAMAAASIMPTRVVGRPSR